MVYALIERSDFLFLPYMFRASEKAKGGDEENEEAVDCSLHEIYV